MSRKIARTETSRTESTVSQIGTDNRPNFLSSCNLGSFFPTPQTWQGCCLSLLKMKRFLAYLFVMALVIGRAEVPKLLTERAFTSAALAEAVNHYVAIGETATIKELQQASAQEKSQTELFQGKGFSVDERIGWVCRILYEPKLSPPTLVPKTGAIIPGTLIPLRAPRFGVLNIPKESMPADKWPLYPIALSGSTYLVLNQHYTPDGSPEDATHYLDYCRKNGLFRKSPVPVPTQEQALQDAAALRQSEAWKAISWQSDGGFTYPMGEQLTWSFLKNQARFIPDQPASSQIAAKKPQPKAGSTVASVR